MINIKEYFEEWERSECSKLTRQTIGTEETKAKRSYIHFDHRRPGSTVAHYRGIFINPDKLKTKIAFWPFLKIDLKEPRIKNAKKGYSRKKEVKERSVYFAAHQDALVYSWYSFCLNKFYEPLLKKLTIAESVTAYRKIPQTDDGKKNKCNIHFSKEVFDFVKNRKTDCAALVADITGFFDNLDHDHLKNEWKRVLGLSALDPFPEDHQIIYDNLTRFKYADAERVYKAFEIKFKTKKSKVHGKVKVFRIPTRGGKQIKHILSSPFSRKDFVSRVVRGNLIQGNQNWNKEKRCHKGIMQGSPISATLANIYMLSFDKIITDLLSEMGGIYRRYSDDIVIVCDIKNYEVLRSRILDEIKKYQLEINPSKTDATFFIKNPDGILVGRHAPNGDLKNMQYLGFEFDGRNIFIRPKSLTKYYRKMKSKVRKAVSMAFGKASKTKDRDNLVFKKSLYEKFIRKGKRSFISYALRSDKIMGGGTIKRQLSRRSKIMQTYLSDRSKHKRFIKAKKNPSKT